jgi:hypothetical protein
MFTATYFALARSKPHVELVAIITEIERPQRLDLR